MSILKADDFKVFLCKFSHYCVRTLWLISHIPLNSLSLKIRLPLAKMWFMTIVMQTRSKYFGSLFHHSALNWYSHAPPSPFLSVWVYRTIFYYFGSSSAFFWLTSTISCTVPITLRSSFVYAYTPTTFTQYRIGFIFNTRRCPYFIGSHNLKQPSARFAFFGFVISLVDSRIPSSSTGHHSPTLFIGACHLLAITCPLWTHCAIKQNSLLLSKNSIPIRDDFFVLRYSLKWIIMATIVFAQAYFLSWGPKCIILHLSCTTPKMFLVKRVTVDLTTRFLSVETPSWFMFVATWRTPSPQRKLAISRPALTVPGLIHVFLHTPSFLLTMSFPKVIFLMTLGTRQR